jgi:putative transcriptional regulator
MLRNNLKFLRGEKGLNQSETGRYVGVSRQTISSIEGGEYNPSISLVLKLAELFDVKVEEIFWMEDEDE